jgi:hypothetical protein
VHRYNGEGIEVAVETLMHMLPLSQDALLEEETYLQELQRREGRHGKEITDMTVDAGALLLFRAADALELKANAFAIHGNRREVGTEEMRESICLVERTLTGLSRIVQDGSNF